MDLQGKKVLVLGAGISGISVAGVLRQKGAMVTLNDAKSEQALNKDFSCLINSGVNLALGYQDETLLDGIDLVVVSPGISIFIPLIKSAKSRGISVVSEIEVAYQLCKAPILAITGTNGKTTTTTLIGEMMKTTNNEVVVGGNIGLALSQEVEGVSESGVVVAEISSFQLEGIREFRPHIAAVLNISPDHLDRHHSMETYIETKERIFYNQTEEDYLILNYDDSAVRKMAGKAKGKVFFFSRVEPIADGIFVRNGEIVIRLEGEIHTVCPLSLIQIPGTHNIENVLAACAVAFLAGVSLKNIASVVGTFSGVEHRIEPVKEVNGVMYYNDSKATNPESSVKALEAFPGHMILIAGGRDKNTDLSVFMNLILEKVEHLILLGEAQKRFYDSAVAAGFKNIHAVNSMSEAVTLAHQIAQPSQVVLLSPACSSYDMFKNYEERGRIFKELVHQL